MANIYSGLYFLIFGIIVIVFNGPISRFHVKVWYKLLGQEYSIESTQIVCVAGGIVSLLAAIVIFMEIWGVWAIIGGVD